MFNMNGIILTGIGYHVSSVQLPAASRLLKTRIHKVSLDPSEGVKIQGFSRQIFEEQITEFFPPTRCWQ